MWAYGCGQTDRQTDIHTHRHAWPQYILCRLRLTQNVTTLIIKNCSHVCAYHCAQLSYTTQHRTVLIIFPLILQAIIIAQAMMSAGAEGNKKQQGQVTLTVESRRWKQLTREARAQCVHHRRAVLTTTWVKDDDTAPCRLHPPLTPVSITCIQVNTHRKKLVIWSLTSLFSTNTAISKTKG